MFFWFYIVFFGLLWEYVLCFFCGVECFWKLFFSDSPIVCFFGAFLEQFGAGFWNRVWEGMLPHK